MILIGLMKINERLCRLRQNNNWNEIDVYYFAWIFASKQPPAYLPAYNMMREFKRADSILSLTDGLFKFSFNV